MELKIKLDTTSEFVCDASKWPEVDCNVLVECPELAELAHLMFDTKPENAYIDIYAKIEPERRLVTSFLIIDKKDDGTQEEFLLGITDPADTVEYFYILESQGKGEFTNFITEACSQIHIKKLEALDEMANVVDNFLTEKDIRIPSSDKEMEENGALIYRVYWNNGYKKFESYEKALKFRNSLKPNCGAGIMIDEESNSARIYGTDYHEMTDDFAKVIGQTDDNIVKDRLFAMASWAEKYNPDELFYYTELSNIASISQIEAVWGKETASIVKEYWQEHGIN